ncbi:MAG TPA: response regulator, partial [Chthoniobacterales bacterium]
GVIDARSEGANSGATFAVTLPCLAAAPTTEPPKAEEPERISSLRLLLVEDHPDTAEILRLLLASRGYDVRTAASVEEATQVATEFEFDMLISDIGLPDGRGTDLLTRLQTQLDRTIPAIAMSGFGMQDDLLRSRSAGFAEHLTKPIELATLQRAITRIAAMAPGIPAAR